MNRLAIGEFTALQILSDVFQQCSNIVEMPDSLGDGFKLDVPFSGEEVGKLMEYVHVR